MIKDNFLGRSMIEMLGVLAIIGVLSVGGIAGYSKAMMKYKINKAIEQITMLSQNIRTFYASQKNYSGITCNGDNDDSGCKVIKKAHLAPDEMYQDSSNPNLIYDPWGEEVDVWLDSKNIPKNGVDDNKAFIIYFPNVEEEPCMAILSHDWSSATGLIAIGGNPGDEVVYSYYGCEGSHGGEGHSSVACAGGKIVGIPMPVTDTLATCEYRDLALKFF